MKIISKELIFGILGLLILGEYFLKRIDLDALFHQNPPTPMHLSNTSLPSSQLTDAKITDIPSELYDTFRQEKPRYVKLFSSNKKYVVTVYWITESNGIKWNKILKEIFKANNFYEYYLKYVPKIVTHSWYLSYCHPSKICPQTWVYQNCMNKVCIIHPTQKKAIILSTSNPSRLSSLLDKYKEW